MAKKQAKAHKENDQLGPENEAAPLRPIEEYQINFENGFHLLGITDFPPYTNAREFSNKFERCTILRSENILFSMTSSASLSSLKPKT